MRGPAELSATQIQASYGPGVPSWHRQGAHLGSSTLCLLSGLPLPFPYTVWTSGLTHARATPLPRFPALVPYMAAPTTGSQRAQIIGGQEVLPLSRPYMASVSFEGQHHCGGFLFRAHWVVSAAHCFRNR
jgi:hypothetical protein